jgi:UDP-3-O-[3-hydroxymyristoyl] glucosamine N-acyltransferase
MTLFEIAQWLGGELHGKGEIAIERVAKIEEAREQDLTFLANPKYAKFIATTRAGAVLVGRSFDIGSSGARSDLAFVKVDDPYVAFLHVLKRLMPQIDPFTGDVHASAVISPSARIAPGVTVGAYAVIDDGAEVGEGSRIGHGVVIGKNAVVGRACLLYPNVVISHSCRLGDRVTLHSGTVVGSDGFGFAPQPDGTYEKIPQLGIVVIEDDVEVGSNCSIDRATMGETRIRKGAKLDNLIQIAHNVTIGENTVIAAQVGISGSVKVGKNVMLAGQVGIAGHLEIADKTIILAQSGIPKSITEPGKVYLGYPAKERGRAFRIEAIIRSLPELAKELESLKKELEALKQRKGS